MRGSISRVLQFKKVVDDYNLENIPLNAGAGHVSGFGQNDAEYEASFPTPGEMVVPTMGYAYGVQAEALGDIPMAMPVGELFTPTAVPVAGWAPIPEATPLVMPTVVQGIVLVETVPDNDHDDDHVNEDGDLSDGDDDDDGDEGGGDEEEEVEA